MRTMRAMDIQAHVVNAFIDGDSGGNPAGVVLDADALTPAQKLAVAQQVGLSETAFVSRSAVATLKLEFFTPRQQIAHCGHATIATFSLLRQRGALDEGQHAKETIDGVRAIVIDGDLAFMEQRAPRYRALESTALRERVLDSLGLLPTQLAPGQAPVVVDTGNAFLLVPIADETTLAALTPQQAPIEALSDELDLIGVYAFCRTTRRPGRDAAARMFAPRYGIAEEAGTGMAAGPLACWLHDRANLAGPRLHVEQGWLMRPPSPSVIRVDLQLRGGAISGLMAGGRARLMSSRTVRC